MKLRILFTLIATTLMAGMAVAQIPATAVLVDESDNYFLYLNDEKVIDDELNEKVTSVWLQEKASANVRRLYVSPEVLPVITETIFGENARQVSQTTTINSAGFFPYNDKAVVVQGVVGARNIFTYIIRVDTGKILMLPTNSSVIGFTAEDGDVLVESYDYYPEGGRFAVVQAFDDMGISRGIMRLKREN